MNVLRFGVVGVGHLGKIHAKLIGQVDSAELVAVADPSPAGAEIAAEHDVAYYQDYSDLMGKIDCAIVATPTRSHFEICRTLLSNGIHVLVEKPMTLSSTQSQTLVDLANEMGLTIQVGHVERFNPAFCAAKPHMNAPVYIDAVRASGYTFRSTDVGVVHDLMIHDIDLVLSIAKSKVTSVQAMGGVVFGGQEDIAQARIEFENGCVANLSASRASYEPARAMKVFTPTNFVNINFAESSAVTVSPCNELLSGEVDFASFDSQQQQEAREELFTKYLPKTEIEVTPHNAILEEHKDFVRCVFESDTPVVSGADGSQAVLVCEMILEQIANSAIVPMASTQETPTFIPVQEIKKSA